MFVRAAEVQLATKDVDPPAGWWSVAGARTEAVNALRRLKVYPPSREIDDRADDAGRLYELAGATALMIEPTTVPAGMLLTLLQALDDAADALNHCPR